MSNVVPPRGPPGYNGTQGPVGSPGPSGPRGSPGPGANLSLCRYKKETSAPVKSDFYAGATVSVTEQKVGTQSSHIRGYVRKEFPTGLAWDSNMTAVFVSLGRCYQRRVQVFSSGVASTLRFQNRACSQNVAI